MALCCCFKYFLAVPPSVQASSTVVSSALNTSATLFCVFRGFPQPSILWLKSGIPITVGSNTTITTLSATSTEALGMLSQLNISFTGDVGAVSVLQFSSLQRDDNGTYSCQATNRLNQTGSYNAFSNQISLKVLGKTVLSACIKLTGMHYQHVLYTDAQRYRHLYCKYS